MEHKYVTCNRCSNWTQEERRYKTCRNCCNSKEVVDPTEILCNLCGGPQRPLGTINEQYPQGLEDAKVTGGYDSYHLLDGNNYSFNFCEKCLRGLFNQCKIKPRVSSIMVDIINNWVEDQSIYEYRLWQDNGGHHQSYLDYKCNAIKDCPNKAVYTILLSDDFTEDCCCEDHKEVRMYGNSKLTKFIPNVLKPFL